MNHCQKEMKKKDIEDALVKGIPVEMCRWVTIVNGEPYCHICKKCATEGHLKSIEHVKRIEEDALGTYIAGEAQTTRRFNGDLCKGVPTKTMIYEFWGNAVENMVKWAMEIHRAKGFFFLSGKNRSLQMRRSTN